MLFLESEIMANITRLLPDILFMTFSFSALVIVNGRRFNMRNTLFISIPLLFMLFVANLLLFAYTDIGYINMITFFTMFLPQCILSLLIGRKRGWFSVASSLNAFLVVHMVTLIETTFRARFDYLATTYIIYIIFLPLMLYFLKSYYCKLQELIEKSLPQMIYIIILLGLAICIEIMIYGLMVRDTEANVLRLDIFGIAIISIYILAVSAFYLIMNQYQRKALEIKNQAILDNSLQAVTDKLRLREMKEDQLRVLRHDMKHLLISCGSLINAGKNDEAMELIRSYTNVIDSTSDKIYCKDPIINALLDYYTTLAKENNIRIEININNIEDALTIPSSELSIFLSNCLDNAINALLKLDDEKRYLYIKFINNDGRLVLQIKNNFNGSVILDRNNKPTSIYEGHGIGSTSIERFAERNNLLLSYDIQANVFIINVLFTQK